jgi:hypothetical protein
MRKVLAVVTIIAGLSGCARSLPRPTETAEQVPASFRAQHYLAAIADGAAFPQSGDVSRTALAGNFSEEIVPGETPR